MNDSRLYQRRINQKLAYARHLLHDTSEAAREAALWHLSLAYQAWLAEISADPHQPLPFSPEASATALAEAAEFVPAALAECVQLEQSHSSWLAQLLRHADAAASLINTPPKPAGAGMISLSDAESVLPDVAAINTLAAQLAAMIERYREAMLEY